MPPSKEAQDALDALDKALAGKPHKDGHDFTASLKHLCAYRDALTAEFRAAGTTETHAVRQRLAGVNAIISTVLAGHFPLGPIPWPEIEHARETLVKLTPAA